MSESAQVEREGALQRKREGGGRYYERKLSRSKPSQPMRHSGRKEYRREGERGGRNSGQPTQSPVGGEEEGRRKMRRERAGNRRETQEEEGGAVGDYELALLYW